MLIKGWPSSDVSIPPSRIPLSRPNGPKAYHFQPDRRYLGWHGHTGWICIMMPAKEEDTMAPGSAFQYINEEFAINPTSKYRRIAFNGANLCFFWCEMIASDLNWQKKNYRLHWARGATAGYMLLHINYPCRRLQYGSMTYIFGIDGYYGRSAVCRSCPRNMFL